ncbi:four helix bundle protein [Mangrovibacterium marinum]|uniref:Four helix bundle protein n=1 Tax=Mangrovibacterium marinum TaxID=1639118 RepID=A0A2T5C0X2_9BACT|nr:four helix bundle protein [Mangrovibacterium marinum]PTN08240.1 four helix bundle protein [Mangrovibacterium marinum]
MSSYHDLDIYKIAFRLALDVHKLSLQLPKFEIYEQGSQVRRSSKSVKDQIVEGYGRKRYKADFIKFLTYAQGSNDECTSQIETILELYPQFPEWKSLLSEYDQLGKKINKFIQYVESNWKVQHT